MSILPHDQPKEPVVMTKKKLRKLNRLTVAQLKQLVDRPDVVEMHDVTALDPKVLIILKVSSCTVESITNDFFFFTLVLCPVIYCTYYWYVHNVIVET